MSLWFFFAIVASVLWGLSYVSSQYILRTLSPIEILLATSIFMAVSLSIYTSFAHQWLSFFNKFGTNYKLPLATMAYVIIYFAASFFILRSVAIGDASLAAIVESSYPLFTIFFSYIILREVQISWGMMIGVGLIISGLVIVHVTSSKLPVMH